MSKTRNKCHENLIQNHLLSTQPNPTIHSFSKPQNLNAFSMKLSATDLNLFDFFTSRVENRVGVVRIFPSHSQIQQFKCNQDAIRFVKNALLSAIQRLNFALRQQHGAFRYTSDSDRLFLSKLDEIVPILERVKAKQRQALQSKIDECVKEGDLKKMEAAQNNLQKAEQSWENYPVILDQVLFNKLLLWLKEGFPFLKRADSVALVQAVRELLQALKGFVNSQGKQGYPRFKSKRSYNPRILFTNAKIMESGRVKLPKFPQEIRLAKHCYDLTQMKSATVVFRNGKWLIQLLLQNSVERKPSQEMMQYGLDVGVANSVTLSDGRQFSLPMEQLNRLELRKRKYQRDLARRKKGSLRYRWLTGKIAKLSRKMAYVRRDWQRKLAYFLVFTAKIHHLTVEKLNIQAMSHSAKGTLEKHGKNVAQKSGLNRSILNQAWYQLFEFLREKIEDVGGTFCRVDPKFSSQTCSCCQHKSKENRPNQSTFLCTKCGFACHADVNAAINLRERGKVFRVQRKAEILEKCTELNSVGEVVNTSLV